MREVKEWVVKNHYGTKIMEHSLVYFVDRFLLRSTIGAIIKIVEKILRCKNKYFHFKW